MLFHTIIEPPTGLGTEDTGPKALTWPYFDLIHEYCSERHNINPPNIVDTETDNNAPSTSGRAASTSHGRKRKGDELKTDVAKQLKLLERATKLYIKYMSTLVELSGTDDSDVD